MLDCKYCGRKVGMPCKSTRDMEDANNVQCYDALMRQGGGEYTVNQQEAQRRKEAGELWFKKLK